MGSFLIGFFAMAPVLSSNRSTVPRGMSRYQRQARSLAEIGSAFHQRGWSLGTSSNFSVVVERDPLRLLITASGKDKGRLGAEDFVVVGEDGKAVDPDHPKPSAETLLHVVAARHAGAGAVLHTHSPWATVLSDLYAHDKGISIEGFEMLKGLEGIATHEHSKWLDIFPNTQDIPRLAEQVKDRLNGAGKPLEHGFLIQKHGLYAWGRDLDEARRHVEVFEFLFEALGRRLWLDARRPGT